MFAIVATWVDGSQPTRIDIDTDYPTACIEFDKTVQAAEQGATARAVFLVKPLKGRMPAVYQKWER